MKKKLITVLAVLVGIFTVVSIIISVIYPIRLKIDSNIVSSAKITYYGDGMEQEITEQKDIKKLVNSLNKLRFKESENMSHLSPHSGVLMVELYDNKGKCIEDISFYEWVYRDGEYLTPMEGLSMNKVYSLCNELCGNPFYVGNEAAYFTTWLAVAIAIIIPVTAYLFGKK